MSHNTFGHLFRMTTFGESHGPAMGCVVDGCPPGINLDGPAQHAGQRLETGFGDVVAIVAVERLHMQRHAGIHGKGLEPFAHQFGVELADLGAREVHFPDEEGAARDIDCRAGQRFIHGQETIGIAADALAVAQRLGKGLAQGNACVFRGVVDLDGKRIDKVLATRQTPPVAAPE